jgi:hypothetical protein
LISLGAKPEKAQADICDLAVYAGATDLIDAILPIGTHTDGGRTVMRPVTSQFATWRSVQVPHVTITTAIKEAVKQARQKT